MKLKDTFVTHKFDDTFVIVNAEKNSFNGIINGNQTAGFIVECLKEDITIEQIIGKMLEKYDAPFDVITEDVNKIIDTLKDIGAIDE